MQVKRKPSKEAPPGDEFMAVPKVRPRPKRVYPREVRAYLDWCAEQPCWICKSRDGVVGCHYRGAIPKEDFTRLENERGAASLKPADWWALPMCWLHHGQQGGMSHDEFDELVGLSMKDACRAYFCDWMQRNPVGQRWRADHGD
jgi:hypothetical protein